MTTVILFFILQSSFPPEVVTLLELAQEQVNKSELDKAQRTLDKALEIDPNNYLAFYWKGYCHMNNNELDKAIDNFTQSIVINNQFPEAYNTRGLCYGYKEEVELALADFDRAIIIDENFVEAYVNRGSALIGKKNFDMAKADFKKAIEIDPENGSPHFHRGRVHQISEDWKSAIDDFQSAIQKGFVNAESLYELGNSLYQNGEYSKAVQSYSVALEFDSKHHRALNNRALSYEKLGKNNLAEKDRKKLREMAGINFQAYDKIKYKEYPSKDKDVSLLLPSGWYVSETQEPDRDEELFEISAYDDESKKHLSARVKVRVSKNMQERFGVSNPQALQDFWRGSNGKNTEKYESYVVASQKLKKIGGKNIAMFETKRVINKGDMPIGAIEMVAASENELIVIYFEAPVTQYDYFKTIFENSIKKIKFQ
jgi:tetratricopeptide (TPR) repeat protein